jgi:hypothetical protein
MDDEIREIKRQILLRDVAMYSNMMEAGGVRKTDGARWMLERDRARDALRDGDSIGAMRTIWESIRDYWEFIPEMTASHLGWLAAQMENYFGSDEERYKSGVEELLAEMASRPDILAKLSVKFTKNFASALAAHGFEVAAATPERHEAAAGRSK